MKVNRLFEIIYILLDKKNIKADENHTSWQLQNINAAIRETHEELGIIINENDLVLIDTYLNKVKLSNDIYINHFTYLYIVKKDIDISKIKILEKEVEEIKFINKEEYYNLLDNNEMVEGMKYCNKLLEYIK